MKKQLRVLIALALLTGGLVQAAGKPKPAESLDTYLSCAKGGLGYWIVVHKSDVPTDHGMVEHQTADVEVRSGSSTTNSYGLAEGHFKVIPQGPSECTFEDLDHGLTLKDCDVPPYGGMSGSN